MRTLSNIICGLMDRWLEPYFDQELGLVRAGLVRAHVGQCSTCRSRLKEMEALRADLIRSIALAPQTARMEHLWARISSRLPYADPIARRSSWFERLERWFVFPKRVWVSAAAVLVLAVALGSIWQSQSPLPVQSNSVIIDSLETRHSLVTIVQPERPGDMTVIWIDEDSGEGSKV